MAFASYVVGTLAKWREALQGSQDNQPTKIEKKVKSFIFGSAGCSLSRAEGFSCSLDVL
jgi:hypothetical protein